MRPSPKPPKANTAEFDPPVEWAWDKRRVEAAHQIEIAALKLFAARGVADVTVEEIAEAAGISRRTFYRYFETPDDVLAAMPKRMMRRISQSLRARPLSETVFDSFLAVMRKLTESDQEVEINRLTRRAIARSPEIWSRAVGRIRMHTTEVMEEIMTERLRAVGKDPAAAGVMAATFLAVIIQVNTEAQRKGQSPSVADCERAFRSLVEIVKAPSSKRARRPAARKQSK